MYERMYERCLCTTPTPPSQNLILRGSATEEEEEEDEVDTVEKPISTDGWHIFCRECPKEEIVFLCQVIILYTVIVVSIYNLTVEHGDSTLWTALLSSSLGYLLPNPSLKR